MGNIKSDYRKKAKELSNQMQIEELLWQMTICDMSQFLTDGVFDEAKAEDYFGGHSIGGVIAPKTTPDAAAAYICDFNNYIKKNKKNIPPFIISEMLHGVTSPGMTVFPQSLTLGATFDKNLVERVAGAIGDEAESVGINQGLSPVLDLALDPRWGRVEECYGEDPYLVSELGKKYVHGLQKISNGHTRIAATVKHFAVHGNPEGGVNLAASSVGEREMRRLYLQPFRQVIREEKPLSVMPAYSENDGIPCHRNKRLLQDILRDEMGFDGYLISDFGAIDMLLDFHMTDEDIESALGASFKAGLDLEAPGMKNFIPHMKEALRRGLLSEEVLRKRVENILYVKFSLGLFEEREPVSTAVDWDAHKQLAFEAACKSVVLLENRDNILPLVQEKYPCIAIIGPAGSEVEFGDYSIRKEAAKIDEELQGVFPGSKVLYAPGCEYFNKNSQKLLEAEQTADSADLIILAVGERSVTNFGIGWGVEDETIALCGEGYDSCTLQLSPAQEELCNRMLKKGKPVILLQVGGRPLALGNIYDRCDAVLQCFYGGEMFAKAIAEILAGKISPSGKLPVSIPRSVGNLPCYYHHKPSSRGFYHRPGSLTQPGRDYVTETPGALYSFGYGKSYTQFVYEELCADTSRFAQSGIVDISVTLRNDGGYDAEESVLLFVEDMVSTVTVPVKELKGFERIALKAGERGMVSFEVSREGLSVWNEDMQLAFESGEFRIMAGDLSQIISL